MNRRAFIGMTSLLALSAAAIAGVGLLTSSGASAKDDCCGPCPLGCEQCPRCDECPDCTGCDTACVEQKPEAGCCEAPAAATVEQVAATSGGKSCCSGGN